MDEELNETEHEKLCNLLTELIENRNIKMPIESNMKLDAFFYDIEEAIVDYFKAIVNNETEDKDERLCSNCNKKMNKGFCVNSGEEYYCSDKCLHTKYSDEEWEKMYVDGESDSYYTEWED